ncbi:unnamed protein product [Pelagomonas calceolata]|uniref:Uncharacterized protein n=1 Tax=Pelagomonas calceolata TaxID=35677 RepID=A0A8J2X1B2_9STRA|nr:unnamed protein product [Pelagomonas calceolata]|mmetsp:Transcript_9904/g.29153  ORF Transcript_9904/g.29153 Transcript_9904/m.29153 type:complete len:298 (+) Transcript_9904:925-1818(+)
MASQPQRSRSRSRDDSDADPPRRDPEREQLERDLDDLERWKETGELPPGYDSREQLERDLADLSRLNDQRELPPGYSYLPPRPPPPPRRFQRSDRVVCSLGGGFGWLPGAVQSVNEPNPQDPTELFPYVVKLDPPLGKLISVPEDRKNFCRSEICFDGDVPGGAQFSIACLPLNPTKKRRFAVGDKVCVAVEDPEDVHTDWAAGEVVQVDVDVGAASKMPYRVRLDDTGGRSVLVHREEHRFIRSRDLQAPGPRTGATRVLDKFVTRQKKDGSWEKVDHETLKVRACADPNADEGDY